MYRALRDHDPVHHVVPPQRPEHDYYVLSRHADVWSAARDHQTFSSAQGLTVNYGELEMIGLRDTPPMVMQDPPVHTEFRKLVSRGFTPRQVETVEPTVRKSSSGSKSCARAAAATLSPNYSNRSRRWWWRTISVFPKRIGRNSTAGPRPSWRRTRLTAPPPAHWTRSAR
ncbi:Putative cytochrome p450 130 cyp130 (part1) [Mycobacterium canettii CIPT 140070017]|nr:Putative cytochrome p450 130 cyp130 (part1) [Mycobacterium canettii CIPT 140070017]